MLVVPEGIVALVLVVPMLRRVIVVVAEITVMLQEVHHHLGHMRPLVQVHGTEAIEGKCEEEQEAAHLFHPVLRERGESRRLNESGRKVFAGLAFLTPRCSMVTLTIQCPAKFGTPYRTLMRA